MAKKAAPQTAPPEIVWKGPESLRPFLIPIDSLFPDLANVNEHGERSIADIAASYDRFGQQKNLVVDTESVVRAGNGQLEAAKRLGWTHIAATQSDLDGVELTLFAVADNQTPKSSMLNYAKLSETLRKANDAGVRTDSLGFSPDEIKPLLEKTWVPPQRHGGPGGSSSEGDGAGDATGDESGDGGSAEPAAPAAFPSYDESIPVEHECPKCGYKFSDGKKT